MSAAERSWDAIVVGGGFGGLGAALRLVEAGRSVLLLERVGYLGGCACTFEHEGDHFEGGATLFAGLGEGELFGRWIARYGLDVPFERLERPVELRAGAAVRVSAHRDRAQFVAGLTALPGAPVAALQRFFALQAAVAERLWALFDEPSLLPPLTLQSALRHVARSPRYVKLLPLLGRTLWSVLARHGLTRFAPLVHWLDAQCQITVQCSAREADALFAFAALDYHHRGAAHVRGGIGVLASELGRAFERAGGRLQMRSAVSSVERHGGEWRVTARGMTHRARAVFLNVLPQVAQRIVRGVDVAPFERAAARVRTGWGAAALFRVLAPPLDAPPGPLHLELVDDVAQPFVAGNHVFLSIGAAGEGVRDPALRRATASTHVDLNALRALDEDGQRRAVDAVHARMRETIARRAPEWTQCVRELTASPRTYARWVGRGDEAPQGTAAAAIGAATGGWVGGHTGGPLKGPLGGWVGGVPRRAGVALYRELFARTGAHGLTLVGDSVFPGQSTLACALGAMRGGSRA
ncbi:MAG: NAD(P)-binding protein [Planctomycetota bacterium]